MQPTGLASPQAAASTTFAIQPAGILQLAVYGLADTAQCGERLFPLSAGSSIFLDTYNVDSVDLDAHTLSLQLWQGFHRNLHDVTKLREQCEQFVENTDSTASAAKRSCACLEGRTFVGWLGTDGQLQWKHAVGSNVTQSASGARLL